jgi:tetratricopeptide (TPR) repeat protein
MFKTFPLACLLLALTLTCWSQGAGPRERSPLDATRWGVIYDIPETKRVSVKPGVSYFKDANADLQMDIYMPPGAKTSDRLPAVIFLNAIGDAPGNKVKDWEIYKSWPRLVAAHGMVGISMDADGARIQESLKALFGYLERDGSKHGIDSARLGVYAASANTTQSLVYLMSRDAAKGIKAAALYYGSSPAAGTPIRTDLSVLFVLAEGDLAGMGQGSLPLWQRIAEAKAPWTMVFGSRLPHAFDAFEDTEESRRVVRQTIEFWRTHLQPIPQPSWQPSEARAIVSAIYWNDPAKALPLLEKYVAANPNDGDAYTSLGRMYGQQRKLNEAGAAYEKAMTLGVRHGGVYNGLGQTRLAQQRYSEAADLLSKAVELGARNSQTYGQLAFAQMGANKNEEAIRTYELAFAAGIPPGANSRGVAYYNMACAYARLKQIDKAFEKLNKAVDEGFSNRRTIETDDDLAPLRGDPRFAELLKRLPAANTGSANH